MTKSASFEKIRDPKRGLLRLADSTKRLFAVSKKEYEKKEEEWRQRNRDNRTKKGMA